METQNQNHPASNKRLLRLIVFVLLVIGAVALWQVSNTTSPRVHLPAVVTNSQPGLYQVTHVDDGDTIAVAQGGITETVRFIGMDTPEVKDPRKPIQCYGAEASAKTKSLLSGKKVRLDPDPLGDNRDKYHRLLRYVYLPDGTFVNETLVKQGYAFAYVIFPFSKLDQFKADEQAAQAAKVGLWGKCQVNTSTATKQTNPV